MINKRFRFFWTQFGLTTLLWFNACAPLEKSNAGINVDAQKAANSEDVRFFVKYLDSLQQDEIPDLETVVEVVRRQNPETEVTHYIGVLKGCVEYLEQNPQDLKAWRAFHKWWDIFDGEYSYARDLVEMWLLNSNISSEALARGGFTELAKSKE